MKSHKPYGLYEKRIKRALDFSLSLLAIFLIWPVLLIISVMVKVDLGKPIIFSQMRPGLNEKFFTIYKFRTMTDEKDENGKIKSDGERLTKVGKMLRSTSLDELPELFNILKGEMAIVGPRPQLVRDMAFMSDKYRRRHEVLPGLTGLAQVNGRNGITWEEKLEKDLEYIDRITFLGDMKIILITVGKVLRRDGINEEGQATALDYGDWLMANGKVDQTEYDNAQKKAIELIKKKDFS